jgi:hypothetical protein
MGLAYLFHLFFASVGGPDLGASRAGFGREDCKELLRRKYANVLEPRWEMAPVTRYNVVRPRFESALHDFVIVGIARNPKGPSRKDENSNSLEASQKPSDPTLVELELRPCQHFVVLCEERLRNVTAKFLRKRQRKDEGRGARRAEDT